MNFILYLLVDCLPQFLSISLSLMFSSHVRLR